MCMGIVINRLHWNSKCGEELASLLYYIIVAQFCMQLCLLGQWVSTFNTKLERLKKGKLESATTVWPFLIRVRECIQWQSQKMKNMFHVLPTRTLLRGKAWNFSKSKSSYRAGKLVFFIFLHISLRKSRAVLLPRGSLGI